MATRVRRDNVGASSQGWKEFGSTPKSATKRLDSMIGEVKKSASENTDASYIVSRLENIKKQASEAILIDTRVSENIIHKASKYSDTGMGDDYHDRVSARNRSVSAVD